MVMIIIIMIIIIIIIIIPITIIIISTIIISITIIVIIIIAIISIIASFYQYRGVKDNKILPPQIYICLINSVAICFNELVNFIFFRKKCYMIYFILEICIL